MNGELITIIGAILVLAIIITVVALIIRKKNNDTNGKAALEFLEGLGDELIKITVSTLMQIDPSKVDSIEEFEVTVLNAVYNNAWDYVIDEMNAALDDDSLTKAILNMIDKDYVIKFIDALCEKSGIHDKIQGEYMSYKLLVNNIEGQDEALAKEYSDEEKYFSEEESVENNLEPAVEPVHTEEEIAALNPQTEEEEEFDATDESMEIIPEEDEVGKVLAIKDSIGRWCFYELDDEGKKNRISKSEAIPRLKEQGGAEEILAELGE